MKNRALSTILILLLSVQLLTGCNDNSNSTIAPKETLTIYIETPLFITNGVTCYKFYAPIEDILWPVKSWEVTNINKNTKFAGIELRKPLTTNIEKNKEYELFKYNDLEKYSFLDFYFETDVTEQKYSPYFTSEFKAIIKLELYADECHPGLLLEEELFSPEVHFYFLDRYNGRFVERALKVDHEKDADTQIIGALKELDYEMVGYLIENNEDFVRIAKEIEYTFENNSTYAKAKAIYDYIVNNYHYDRTRFDEMNRIMPKDNELNRYCSIRQTILKKNGTCDDFAVFYDALAKYHGLASSVIYGASSYQKDNSLHAWNMVLDSDDGTKKYLNVDTTFGLNDPENNFLYYTKNSSFLKEHFVWNSKTNSYTPFIVNVK